MHIGSEHRQFVFQNVRWDLTCPRRSLIPQGKLVRSGHSATVGQYESKWDKMARETPSAEIALLLLTSSRVPRRQ